MYGFLTTDPNAVVGPVHPKAMPVILTTNEERDAWMHALGTKPRRCKRPLPDDVLQICPRIKQRFSNRRRTIEPSQDTRHEGRSRASRVALFDLTIVCFVPFRYDRSKSSNRHYLRAALLIAMLQNSHRDDDHHNGLLPVTVVAVRRSDRPGWRLIPLKCELDFLPHLLTKFGLDGVEFRLVGNGRTGGGLEERFAVRSALSGRWDWDKEADGGFLSMNRCPRCCPVRPSRLP